MDFKFKAKPCINKKNHQINISLPKKDLPKEFRDNISKLKEISFKVENWEW